MPNTNLGHGHGPFPPQGFFVPAVPLVSPGLEDEQDGGFFDGVQRQVALAVVAVAIATSAVSAQAIGGQFEEMPKAIASPGVQQQLVISPTAKEPARLRHFHAAEEIPQAVVTIRDDSTWVIQIPIAQETSQQPSQGVEEFRLATSFVGYEGDDWRQGVTDTPTALPAFAANVEEMPPLPQASPGVQQIVLSPTAKPAIRLQHFFGAEELPTQAAPGLPFEEGWSPPQTLTEPQRPTLFSSTEERVAPVVAVVSDEQEWAVRPALALDPEYLLPAPWIDGGDALSSAVFDEPNFEIPRQIAEPGAVQPFMVSADIVAQPPASISVDDVPDPLSCAQTSVSVPAQPFSTTEEQFHAFPIDDIPRELSLALAQTFVEAPAPAVSDTEERVAVQGVINFDDVPQPVYDRQSFVTPPNPQLFAEAEVEIPPPSIRVDDVPQPTYERQTYVAPPVPQLFTEAELEITPLTLDRAIAQNAASIAFSTNSDSVSILSELNRTISINSAE